MDYQFKLLGSKAVITVDNLDKIVISHPTFRVGELTEALIQDLRIFVTENWGGKHKERLEKGWFEEGINCEILRQGANGWQEGKVRIRVSLEFYADEPEIIEAEIAEMPSSNKPLVNQPESPLDDIRRMISQDT